jgi:3-dehydroquinate dehydratase-2
MSTASRILCISGPNLQLLGLREPEIYGTATLEQVHASVAHHAAHLGVTVETRQTNHEGTIVDWIGDARHVPFDGIVLNPGAYTHTSIAIYDAIKAVCIPTIEVHVSNPDAREEFRRRSRIAPACVARVAGFGAFGYVLALEGLVHHLGERASAHARRTPGGARKS